MLGFSSGWRVDPPRHRLPSLAAQPFRSTGAQRDQPESLHQPKNTSGSSPVIDDTKNKIFEIMALGRVFSDPVVYDFDPDERGFQLSQSALGCLGRAISGGDGILHIAGLRSAGFAEQVELPFSGLPEVDSSEPQPDCGYRQNY